MTTQTFTYSEVFTNIHKGVVKATKELIKGGIFKKDVSNQDKAIIMGIWVKKVSEIYGVEAPKFYFVDGAEGKKEYKRTGGGCYFPARQEIYIFKKASLTTLLHEFRHHLQHTNMNLRKMYRRDHEHDARAWSCSLYYTSAPKAYKKAVEKGLMHFS